MPPNYIETAQLICSANQLTDFYIMGNTGIKETRNLSIYDGAKLRKQWTVFRR